MDNNKPSVLAIMAHPDDIEILIGGTMLHLSSSGCKLGMITMTAGDCGSNQTSKENISRIRYNEAKVSADSIDAWYECAGLMDIEVFANIMTVRKIVELIRLFDPDIVITHSPADYMLDHEETSRIVRTAVFAAAIPLYQTNQMPSTEHIANTPALYYADPIEGVSPLGERIYPTFYVDISNQIKKKQQFLSNHKSQREWLRSHNGIDEYLIGMTEWAESYGRECGVGYAEGFRQHLGHGYPKDAILQKSLNKYIQMRDNSVNHTRI